MKHEKQCGSARGLEPFQLQLEQGLGELGVSLSHDDCCAVLDYLEAVLRANERLNLTRITAVDAAVRLHLLDSLSAMPELEAAPAGNVLDIGSGGGFPGVPLAIASRRRFVLLDSVAKKTVAVQSILDALDRDISASALWGRAEDVARESPGRFAAVVARAVTALPSLVELASPLLASGGRLIALKGRPSDAEVLSGVRVAGIVGMRSVGSRQLVLPGSDELRSIVVYEKVGQGRVALPRRSGLAQHQPLA